MTRAAEARKSLAMMGALGCLATQRDLLIMDEHVHTTLNCGAKMSGAEVTYFRHNDLGHLKRILARHAGSRPTAIVVDGTTVADPRGTLLDGRMQQSLTIVPQLAQQAIHLLWRQRTFLTESLQLPPDRLQIAQLPGHGTCEILAAPVATVVAGRS